MNDYIQSPDGQRVRLIRPMGARPGIEIMDGRTRLPGIAHIDQWVAPEPPEAA